MDSRSSFSSPGIIDEREVVASSCNEIVCKKPKNRMTYRVCLYGLCFKSRQVADVVVRFQKYIVWLHMSCCTTVPWGVSNFLKQCILSRMSSERLFLNLSGRLEARKLFLSVSKAVIRECTILLASVEWDCGTPVVKVDHSKERVHLDRNGWYATVG